MKGLKNMNTLFETVKAAVRPREAAERYGLPVSQGGSEVQKNENIKEQFKSRVHAYTRTRIVQMYACTRLFNSSL